MINLLHTEFFKLRHDKSFWAILMVAALTGGLLIFEKGDLTGKESVAASLYNTPILILFTSVFGGLFIGSDFVDRTLYHEVCAGHSRTQVFFSKAITFFVGSNAILLLFPMLSVLFSTVLHGWGEPFTTESSLYLLKMMLVNLLLNTATVSISMLIGVICKDVGKTIGLPALFHFIIIFILNGQNAKQVARFIPLGQLRLILEEPQGGLTQAAAVGIIVSAVVLTISSVCFRKTELR